MELGGIAIIVIDVAQDVAAVNGSGLRFCWLGCAGLMVHLFEDLRLKLSDYAAARE
jgi:hypothetical protein